MAYIGKQPLVGNYQVLDAIVATTTDTYALTKDTVAVFPQTPSNCIVSLNGVIQAPVSSYTISGSNIVFDSALTGSDSIDFITVLGDVLSIGTPTDGTVSLAKLSATGTKDATTFLRGDNTFQTIGTNTPSFSAYANTDQNNLTDNTWVKLQMNAEFYDTDSKYDITNYRFTPTIAGTYMFGASVYVDGNDTRDTTEIAFYKNGTKLFYASQSVDNDTKQQLTAVIELDTDDYVELYAYADVANGSVFAMNQDGTTSNNRAYWYGYKLIT
jgi:hypothetical protein